jgi:hypothetical protein
VQILCTHVLLFFRFRSREGAAGDRQTPSPYPSLTRNPMILVVEQRSAPISVERAVDSGGSSAGCGDVRYALNSINGRRRSIPMSLSRCRSNAQQSGAAIARGAKRAPRTRRPGSAPVALITRCCTPLAGCMMATCCAIAPQSSTAIYVRKKCGAVPTRLRARFPVMSTNMRGTWRVG